jgi:hypothetical protein
MNGAAALVERPSSRVRYLVRSLPLVVCAAAGVVSVLKGLSPTVVDGSQFYWMFTYGHGFVRRALIGSLVHPLLARTTFDHAAPAIVAAHVIVSVVIIAATVALFRRVVDREDTFDAKLTLILALLVLMCSEWLPTLGHDVGYVDVYVVVLALAGFLLVVHERYVAAAVVASIAPLIHEAFIFLWAPVAIVLLWSCVTIKRDVRRRLLAALLPLASTCAVAFFQSEAAAERAIDALPVSAAMKDGLRAYEIEQTLRSSFHEMIAIQFPGNGSRIATAGIFFLVPSAAILLAAVSCYGRRWRARWTTLAVLVAATLAPLCVLALAWDLSRFLVWANLAAAMALIASGTPTLTPLNETARHRAVPAAALNFAFALVAVFYLASPTVYAYFSEVGMTYSRVPKWFATTRAASVTARMFDAYNVRAPRAVRFQRQLTCFMADDGSRRRPGCLHELRETQATYGPPTLKIPSGMYLARFEFSGLGACDGGEARLDVATTGRFGRILASYSGHMAPGDHFELPFHLRVMDAALAPLEFRATGLSGCVVLSRVDWTDSGRSDGRTLHGNLARRR